MNEKVSVIIPVYNSEAYLPRCLDSVLETDYPRLEIICVNDGSTDHSGEILSCYAESDARFLVITQENSGVSAARNAGLQAASGTFVTFIDSDDWIHPQFFSALIGQMQLHNADVAVCETFCTQEMFTAPDIPTTPLQGRAIGLDTAVNIKHVRAHATGRVYRKSILKGLQFPIGMLPEDTIFSLQTLCQEPIPKIIYLSEPLYIYYNHPNSLVSQLNGADSLDMANMIYRLSATAPGNMQRAYILETTLRMGLSGWYMLYVHKNRRLLRDVSTLLRKCAREFQAIPQVSRKKRLQYTLLSSVPQIYRVMRLMDDPSLRNWEAGVKAQKKLGKGRWN